MLSSAIIKIISFCTQYAWQILALCILLTVTSGIYTTQHFALDSNINKLISRELPWRQSEAAYEGNFPSYGSILVVVEAPTPELSTQAAATLQKELSKRHDLFHSVTEPPASVFFARNALLFQSPDDLARTLNGLGAAEALIHDLATDLSLRGLTAGLSDALLGIKEGKLKLDDLVRPMTMAADTTETVLAGRPASFSWHVLLDATSAEPGKLRRFIDARPILDFGVVEPGRVPSDAIRQTAADLKLSENFQARVRLTGPVPMADEEFATIKEGAVLNGSVTIGIVFVILYFALRSKRIIFAVFLNLLVGLVMTAGLGLLMVGTLNLISVYFAVLFVGLGVDFGIQFSVRYRAERYELNDMRGALLQTGKNVGAPLTLAAAAVAAGFLSFLPTDYKGLSELGLIAGFGMLIAFCTSITLLPALLQLLNPPGETDTLEIPALAPVDEFMERHRIRIIVLTALVVLAGLPLLFWLRFDFNPLNLRSPKVESVATFLDISRDSVATANTINVVSASLKDADATAARVRALPEVARAMTLSSFIPDHQPDKLKLLQKTKTTLKSALDPKNALAPPTDQDNIEALNDVAEDLEAAGAAEKGPGAAAAKRLAASVTQLAKSDQAARGRVEAAIVMPLKWDLDELRTFFNAQTIALKSLPADLVRDWITPDGHARAEITPKGDANNNETLRKFASAVLAVEPTAVGVPISILETGNTVVSAFIQAGIWALLSISLLLWITLRRIGDVLLTLIPLLVAGAVTLELCVVFDLPLNFANIIALPLMLGVGVAFKIYYIMAWRAGRTNLLQSNLTRAVMFSAATTATAFGSLWFSSHPGTSSMGKLLALSLLCTLAAAVLFQPLLMGKPREINEA